MITERKEVMTVRIREARREAGMTQKELATAIGVTEPAISHYETGRRQITVSKLVAIAMALGCSLDDLCEDEEVKR